MSEQMAQWDDLRTVLAIARAGSLSGASRLLKVSHATVFRRLGAMEKRLGVRLFERAARGYVPTPAGEDMTATAERMEVEWLGVQRRLAGQDFKPSGTLRVTTTDALMAGLLAPIFKLFRESYPDITLEVVISNQLFNLTKREADIAIRPTTTPPENLVGRCIGTIEQAVYGPSGQGRLPWIGPDERLGYRLLETWMASEGVAEECSYRVDSVMGMLAAVQAGSGQAVLPCYLADAAPGVVQISPALSPLATELWVLTHPDLRHTLRVRLFLELVGNTLKERLVS